MSDTQRDSKADSEVRARRDFLGQLGKAAVTAPAVALLLSASTKPAAAQYRMLRQTTRTRPSH
jgi:hypothetical protein